METAPAFAVTEARPVSSRPPSSVAAMLELLKPITWFAPMWAFGCGVVSSGVPLGERWWALILGVILAGPMVCGTSQAVNDWFDRHVDAINEPNRPIPSGRLPGRQGLYIAIVWTLLSLLIAAPLGRWGFGAAVVGLGLAWAYSAPPFRLKRNGWWGNATCAACYEGLPWVTGAAVMAATGPGWRILAIAALYSAGAHGIMTLNDFKSVDGDRQTGIFSLPVLLGTEAAANAACIAMTLPQIGVVALLLSWGFVTFAFAVTLLLMAQLLLMVRLMREPRANAPWYNATGTTLYVIGMLITAFALRITS
ncbi:MAG TPA: chlorophyll synthase ChlG [Rhodopila sp.]|jgi:chlorophyll/bacteriochlorophyll a synthase